MKNLKLILLLPLLLSLASCQGNKTSDSIIENPTENIEKPTESVPTGAKIDYAAKVPLRREYKNKNFLTDGIEQVTLKTPIDGDTAHFYLQDKNTVIKSRFFGIDTPESTGKIQPYGKGASNFTTEKLKEANKNGTIVISSDSLTDGVPQVDSTGSRYVCCVWINTSKKNATMDERERLNLLLVQEGWSNVKNVANLGDEISKVFYDAEKQARNLKLNLFSDKPDPLFNYGAYEDVSLLEVKREIEACLKDPSRTNSFAGKNIRFTATVTSYANNTLYLTEYFSKEDGGKYDYGEYAGLNFYTGRSAIPTKFTKTGAYLQVCGVATDSETFGFQASGGSFKYSAKSEDDAKVIISAEDNNDPTDIEHYPHTFEKTTSQIQNDRESQNFEYLYSRVDVEDPVQVADAYKDDSGNWTLTVKNSLGNSLGFSVYLPFVYTNEAGSTYSSPDQFIGKTFNLKGIYSYHKSSSKISYQIVCRNNSEFTEVK